MTFAEQIAEQRQIGWDGTSLREMLEASEQELRETGCYAGVETLRLKESDPIRYEKIFSRLRGGLVNARETAVNISASPIVKELGELCFVLYSPEGDSITLSTGIMVHVHTMSDAIKYMIRSDYEENPGINDGDIFVNNDPQIGNVHNADVQTLVPIFWSEEIVGWAGCVTHVLDNGAVTAGSSAVGPTSRYEDGIDLPALKCGKGDRLFRDYERRCQRAVRTPRYWALDEKTRLAGCHMIRETVRQVIAAEGIDTYKRFIREVIEDGRRAFLARTKELLIPGTYEAPAFVDFQFGCETRLPPKGAVDGMMHAPLQMTVQPTGRLQLSFDGANAWGHHAFNCTPSAMQGGFWVLLTQTVVPNDKVNDGAYFATSLYCPRGSWANPDNPTTAHGDAWYFLVPSFGGLVRSLSRGFQARGFIEEVRSGYAFDGNYTQGGGTDHHGEDSALSNFEVSCVGGGAGIVKDGLDYAAVMWNPEGDMGDVEAWEMIEPLLYLGRRVKPSSAGAGRRRGGSGFESLRMLWKTPSYELQVVGDGAVFGQCGLFGGYPASSGYRHSFKDTDLQETFAKRRPYPSCDGDPGASEMRRLVAGRETYDKRATTMLEGFSEYDLYLAVMRGGPGLGDPLKRAPPDVETDVNEGFVLPDQAERVYGVVLAEDDGKVCLDEAATEKRRQAVREERAQRAVPVRDWLARERENRVSKRRVIPPVADMYRSSMKQSPTWARRYRAFWALDDDFSY